MKGIVKYIVVMALMLAFTMTAQAETVLDFSGQVRHQGFYDNRSLDEDRNVMDYGYLRTRFNVSATVDGNATAFIQFQDSRRIGEDRNASGGFSTSPDIFVHQAYVKIDNLFGEGWGAMGGRFEFAKGNERFFGAVGWDNVGRAWEGGTFWYDNEKYNITLMAMHMEDRSNMLPILDDNFGLALDQDVMAYGVYATLKDLNWDIFAFYEVDEDTTAAGNAWGIDEQSKKMFTFGTYYQRTHEQFDFTLNAAMQSGTVWDDDPMTFDTLYDVSGMMFAFEAGMSMQDERNTRVAVGFDLSSGDDPETANEYENFHNSYWTGHKFNGAMDYFAGGVMGYGLMDIYGKVNTEFTPGWFGGVDIHMFSTAEEYADGEKSIGMEVDLTVKTNRVKGIDLQWGLSFFSASEEFAGDDAESGLWAYCMSTLNF